MFPGEYATKKLGDYEATYKDSSKVARRFKYLRNGGIGIIATEILTNQILDIPAPSTKEFLINLANAIGGMVIGAELLRWRNQADANEAINNTVKISDEYNLVPPAWVLGKANYILEDTHAA